MNGLPSGNTSQTARLLAGARGFAVGWQEVLYVAQPAAGAQWSARMEGRFLTRLLAVRYTFNASGVVANRNPRFELTDNNGTAICAVPAGQGITAGSFETVSLAVGIAQTDTGGAGFTYGCLPDLTVPGDWVWGTQTPGMDVGDQYSSIALLVQRFPVDATMIEA